VADDVVMTSYLSS